MGVELPLRVVVTILECCVTFSGVKLSIRSFVLFVSDGATSVHASYLWLPGRGHIWSRAAGLTSIMASEVTRIVPPSVYSSLTRIMATSQAIPILNCNHELAQSYFTPASDAHNC